MTFEVLSAQVDIALPPLLGRLLAAGKTRYGMDRADWKLNWRDYILKAQPILSCVYDFEWIGPEKASENIEKWLNPTFQSGRTFLPFAISGAGDAYCLMLTATGEIGTGMIWHDRAESAIEYASFESFVFSKLVETAADFEHLLDDFSPSEARQIIIANIETIAPCLPEALNHQLQALTSLEWDGNENASAMITEEMAFASVSILPIVEEASFSVVPRWEC